MTRPVPYCRPTPTPEPHQPDGDRLAAFGRWVLAMHQPRPIAPAQMPECTCGSALVLCPYRAAATRYLGPPATPPPPVSA